MSMNYALQIICFFNVLLFFCHHSLINKSIRNERLIVTKAYCICFQCFFLDFYTFPLKLWINIVNYLKFPNKNILFVVIIYLWRYKHVARVFSRLSRLGYTTQYWKQVLNIKWNSKVTPVKMLYLIAKVFTI